MLIESDYKDDGTNILLDANENAYGPGLPISDSEATSKLLGGLNLIGLNRYPDPYVWLRVEILGQVLTR